MKSSFLLNELAILVDKDLFLPCCRILVDTYPIFDVILPHALEDISVFTNISVRGLRHLLEEGAFTLTLAVYESSLVFLAIRPFIDPVTVS